MSVQARREQFEQLYEDSPLVTPQKPTPPAFQPTPRPRTLSIPNRTSPNSDELKAYQGKMTQSFYHEFNSKDSPPRYSSSKGTGNRSPDVVSSGQLTKNNNVLLRKNSNSPRSEESSENIVTPKSSPTKVIPLFRPTTVVAERTNVEVEKTAPPPPDPIQGKRGRFFSHIRSRSHGNFIVKRDPSEERVSSAGQKNGISAHKENKFHKDWLTPKRKQRSIDDLLGNDDSTSTSSSFEGKQRLVSNVVKNMKNKETPTVLRKLSFSKNEKDFKNMKEKSVTPSKSNKQSALLTSLSGKAGIIHLSNRHKSSSKDSGINTNLKPDIEEKPVRLRSHSTDMAKVPELIAKAVAEAASKRSLAQTRDSGTSSSSDNTLSNPRRSSQQKRETSTSSHNDDRVSDPRRTSPQTRETGTSSSSDDRLSDPPERPPRRRTPCPGQTPRRKGKAPTPPSQSSPAVIEQSKPSNGHHSDTATKSSPEESSKSFWSRFRDASSLDNLESPPSVPSNHLVVRSCENLPDVVHTSSPSSHSNTSYTNLKSTGRPPLDNRRNRDNTDRETSKESQANLENLNANHTDETSHERHTTEVEGLPGGPPPKKPPRTFAYDIYKSTSTPTPETKSEERGVNDNPATKTATPIYAVPVKKSSKMMIPKPPVRSKSDLSKENAKPSVAPKPPHVLAKAKRTSLVDPLSNLEKEEEAAITSEFQRQAHVRYSLRRPNDPPPPSPSSPRQDEEGNTQYESTSKLSVTSSEAQHDVGYSSIHYAKENENSNTERDINRTVSSTHGSAEHKSLGDYEQLTPTASPFVPASCQGGQGPGEGDQPISLTYCPSPDLTYTHTKRSMSDETLYKGSKPGEPVYATPTFQMNNQHADKAGQKELHYMCSILFTDEEEADAGRDRGEGRLRRNSVHGREKVLGTEAEDGNKGRSSLISAWKREFRQSCRQVQSRIKKTVAR